MNLHSRLIRNYNNPARYIADPWVEVIIVSIVVVKDFGEGKATGVMSRGLVRISAFGDDPSLPSRPPLAPFPSTPGRCLCTQRFSWLLIHERRNVNDPPRDDVARCGVN